MTAQPLTEPQITEQLLGFIRERFLDGDPKGELAEDTPLLEWGVLNSLNTMVLLAHIRKEFGFAVPSVKINPRDLKNVRAIAAMVAELAAANATPTATPAPATTNA